MGCTLANEAVINPERGDAEREQAAYGSESSSEGEDDGVSSRWRLGAGRGHAEEDRKRAAERKKKAAAKQEAKKSPKTARKAKDKQTVRLDSQLQQMILDSSFEDTVIQHVEGTLTNVARKVTPYPYQRDGRIGTLNWGKVIMQEAMFEDTAFPADHTSLYDQRITAKLQEGTLLPKRKRRRARVEQLWRNVTWVKPAAIYGPGQYHLIHRIDAGDITQGLLGDCFLLSALAALAEQPKRIKDMFLSKSVTQSGAYAVRLYVNGEPQDVVVDDSFPYDETPEVDTYAFSRQSVDREIWVQVLEKAYAKVYGSYEAIEGGKPYQAFNTLTGFPSDCIVHKGIDEDSLWERIREAAARDLPMVTSVNSVVLNQAADIKASGLADHHAYTLLTARTIIDPHDGSVVRLVKLRNPYGTRAKREWHGEWNSLTAWWMKQLRGQIAMDDKLDGLFWMAFNQYVQFFYMTTICLYQDGYSQISLSDTHAPSGHGLTKLVVHEDIQSDIVFKLSQIHRRFLDGWLEGTYDYAPMQLYLARVNRDPVVPDEQSDSDTEELRLVDGWKDSGRPVVYLSRRHLKKGEYLLFYRAAWTDEVTNFDASGSLRSRFSNASSRGKMDSFGKKGKNGGIDFNLLKFPHTERKLVIGLNFPNNSKLQMQRVETDKYGKDIFLLMRHYYKEKWEAEHGPVGEEML